MDIEVPVFVPFRAEEGTDRWNRWKQVESTWTGYPVFVGESPDGPFNVSAARNHAADRVDWDIAVFADADTIIPKAQLEAGIRAANKHRQMVLPHSRWINIEPEEHATFFLEGYVPFNPKRHVTSGTKSSIVILPREVYDTVNGFDERFRGWGWEDTAFYEAVTMLHGPVLQFEGNIWHLGHERPNADVNRGSDENAIRNRQHFLSYKRVRTAQEMRKLTSGNRVTL